jgi:microsomal dipeptidase-like Zn-dependent dipeptidase
MTNHFFADLHSHITLFPYNMRKENKDGMLYCKNPIIREDLAPNYTQTDVPKMVKGGVRIVFASLYPVEKGFMKIKGSEGKIADDVIKMMTSFPDERIAEIQSDSHSYFHDLTLEFDFLNRDSHKSLVIKGESKACRYKIIKNYNDLKEFLQIDNSYSISNSETKIAVILTIEGGHSFFPRSTEGYTDIEVEDLSNPKTQALLQTIKQNIAWAKTNNVFAITFAHHFYNYLCGQSISFTQIIDWMLDQEDKSRYGFTALGKEVIKELMSKQNGQRPIIIDVKHLSVASRKWFYAQDFTQGIPVIASHTAVNGYKTMDESIVDNDTHTAAQKKYDRSIDYNTWDLNLSDEEIVIIAKRKGLIGVSVDQRVVMGKQRLEEIKKANRFNLCNNKKRDKTWSFPIFDTIIHIATVLHTNGFSSNELWDTMNLGSDFDGLINPINAYRTVADYPTLRDNLLIWFKESRNSIDVLKGKTDAEFTEIIVKITNKNCLQFLERNFI